MRHFRLKQCVKWFKTIRFHLSVLKTGWVVSKNPQVFYGAFVMTPLNANEIRIQVKLTNQN